MFARTLTNEVQNIWRSTNHYQKKSDLIEKTKDKQRNYTEEKSLVANRYINIHPSFLITKKMEIKMIMGLHFTY